MMLKGNSFITKDINEITVEKTIFSEDNSSEVKIEKSDIFNVYGKLQADFGGRILLKDIDDIFIEGSLISDRENSEIIIKDSNKFTSNRNLEIENGASLRLDNVKNVHIGKSIFADTDHANVDIRDSDSVTIGRQLNLGNTGRITIENVGDLTVTDATFVYDEQSALDINNVGTVKLGNRVNVSKDGLMNLTNIDKLTSDQVIFSYDNSRVNINHIHSANIFDALQSEQGGQITLNDINSLVVDGSVSAHNKQANIHIHDIDSVKLGNTVDATDSGAILLEDIGNLDVAITLLSDGQHSNVTLKNIDSLNIHNQMQASEGGTITTSNVRNITVDDTIYSDGKDSAIFFDNNANLTVGNGLDAFDGGLLNIASDNVAIHQFIHSTGENANITVNSSGTLPALKAKEDGAIAIQGQFAMGDKIHADTRGEINATLTDGSSFSGGLFADKSANVSIDASGNSTTLTLLPEEKSRSIHSTTNLQLRQGATLNLRQNAIAPSTTLTVHNDYTGNDGNIVFYGDLQGDNNSAFDQLIIDGDAKGTTSVIVKNIAGLGEPTSDGIKLITVGGNNENGEETFKAKRIVAGIYEYNLQMGSQTGDPFEQNNWYLTNGSASEDTVILPEVATYSNNLLAANTLFNMRLHERGGEHRYIDALTGEERVTSLWLRQVGGHGHTKMANGQLYTHATSYITQIGGDIAQWFTDKGHRAHLGLMAGYARQDNNTDTPLTDYSSEGKVDGYSVGLYATYFANPKNESGAYVDGWVQYNWFDHEVHGDMWDKGDNLFSDKYTSKGFTASLESGYNLKLSEDDRLEGQGSQSYWLQPQAQVTWMGVKSKTHVNDHGLNVKDEGRNNIQLRAGLRLSALGHHAIDSNKNREFQPFVEANYIHNTKNFGVNMDGFTQKIKGARNIGEVKLGLESQINPNVHMWGNLAYQFGSNKYDNGQAMLGIKYAF